MLLGIPLGIAKLGNQSLDPLAKSSGILCLYTFSSPKRKQPITQLLIANFVPFPKQTEKGTQMLVKLTFTNLITFLILFQ